MKNIKLTQKQRYFLLYGNMEGNFKGGEDYVSHEKAMRLSWGFEGGGGCITVSALSGLIKRGMIELVRNHNDIPNYKETSNSFYNAIYRLTDDGKQLIEKVKSDEFKRTTKVITDSHGNNHTAYCSYICNDCANSFGATWDDGHVATFHQGYCYYCSKDSGLCSTGDYTWTKAHTLPVTMGFRD